MYLTYCLVQIYKIMFRRFLFSRIWSSAQDYAVMGYSSTHLCFGFTRERICQVEMICIGGVPPKLVSIPIQNKARKCTYKRFFWTCSMNEHVSRDGTSKRHKSTCYTLMLLDSTSSPRFLLPSYAGRRTRGRKKKPWNVRLGFDSETKLSQFVTRCRL